MTTDKVWLSPEVRTAWRWRMTELAVLVFEGLAQERRSGGFRTIAEWSKIDGLTDLKLGFIWKTADYLQHQANLILIVGDKRGFRVECELPIARLPESRVLSPWWGSMKEDRPTFERGLKLAICEADGKVCAFCEKSVSLSDCQLEHIYPWQKGGVHQRDNLTIACKACNGKKWHFAPHHDRYLHLKRFRGKRVTSLVTGDLREDGWWPVFSTSP